MLYGPQTLVTKASYITLTAGIIVIIQPQISMYVKFCARGREVGWLVGRQEGARDGGRKRRGSADGWEVYR